MHPGSANPNSAHNGTLISGLNHRGSIMVGNRYWMPPPRQFQPMFQEFSTQSNRYATSRKHPTACYVQHKTCGTGRDASTCQNSTQCKEHKISREKPQRVNLNRGYVHTHDKPIAYGPSGITPVLGCTRLGHEHQTVKKATQSHSPFESPCRVLATTMMTHPVPRVSDHLPFVLAPLLGSPIHMPRARVACNQSIVRFL